MSARVLVRSAKREAAIRRLADALGREVEAYGKETGRRLTLFAEDSTLYVIDDALDDELSTAGLVRSTQVEDGGAVVLFLGCAGGASWSGGGW